MKNDTPVIALLGNPNSGKTTIFNELTGARQHVGNYPGVTVERITGTLKTQNASIKVIDLPGIYRLGGASPEEEIVTDALSSGEIDVLVNIVDSTNFERHLYLTVQLSHFNLPVILVLNMSDEAASRGLGFDVSLLERLLGVRVVCTSGSRGVGIRELKGLVETLTSDPEKAQKAVMKPIQYGEDDQGIFDEMAFLVGAVAKEGKTNYPDSYLAEKILEGDQDVISKLDASSSLVRDLLSRAEVLREKLVQEHEMPVAIMLADKRYGLTSGLYHEVAQADERKKRIYWTEKIDTVLTNKFLGIPVFLVAMYFVFLVTFTIGDPLVGMSEEVITSAGGWIVPLLDNYPVLQSLVDEGIIGGVGSVVSFLPTILILFLGIAMLEATGYMARAAFVMDRLMHFMGLHGKSFVPMILGFGCTVPAIMATRSIESKRDRMATIFVLPLISCAARQPIYVLFITALIPAGFQAETMWFLYVLGIVIAIICARILKSTIFKGDNEVFIMELPPYRLPSVKNVLVLLWRRAYMYLKKAGTLILAASIVLWFLNTNPGMDQEAVAEEPAIEMVDHERALTGTPAVTDAGLAALADEEGSIEEVNQKGLELEYSYSGRIGKFFEPVSQYAGMDWKANSALIGAFAAKELFVSQLGILFRVEDEDEEDPVNLREAIAAHYTPLQGLSIMVFCLIGFPCMASIATTRKESGSWAFTLSNTLFLDVLGFVMAVIVYQTGLLFFS